MIFFLECIRDNASFFLATNEALYACFSAQGGKISAGNVFRSSPLFKIQWSTLKKGGLVQGPDDWPVCIAGEGDAMDDDMSL